MKKTQIWRYCCLLLVLTGSVSCSLDLLAASKSAKGADAAWQLHASKKDVEIVPWETGKGFVVIEFAPTCQVGKVVSISELKVASAESKKGVDLLSGETAVYKDKIAEIRIKAPEGEKCSIGMVEGSMICAIEHDNFAVTIPLKDGNFGVDFAIGPNPENSLSLRKDDRAFRCSVTGSATIKKCEWLDQRQKVLKTNTTSSGYYFFSYGNKDKIKYVRVYLGSYVRQYTTQFEIKRISGNSRKPLESARVQVKSEVVPGDKKTQAMLMNAKKKNTVISIPADRYFAYFQKHFKNKEYDDVYSAFMCGDGVRYENKVDVYDIFDDIFLKYKLRDESLYLYRVSPYSRINGELIDSWILPRTRQGGAMAMIQYGRPWCTVPLRMGPDCMLEREPGTYEFELVGMRSSGSSTYVLKKFKAVNFTVEIGEKSKAAYEFLKEKGALGFLSDFYIARKVGQHEERIPYYKDIKECLQTYDCKKLKNLVADVIFDAIVRTEPALSLADAHRYIYMLRKDVTPYVEDDCMQLIEIAALANKGRLLSKLKERERMYRQATQNDRLTWWIARLEESAGAKSAKIPSKKPTSKTNAKPKNDKPKKDIFGNDIIDADETGVEKDVFGNDIVD
ncbi:MAG: hypothetical protein HRU15_16555 [Planctomycetes bacterium]|nr:hypothetical protein [Planctomycetota bacterium]